MSTLPFPLTLFLGQSAVTVFVLHFYSFLPKTFFIIGKHKTHTHRHTPPYYITSYHRKIGSTEISNLSKEFMQRNSILRYFCTHNMDKLNIFLYRAISFSHNLLNISRSEVGLCFFFILTKGSFG